jgi:hypothetical protein
MASANTSAVVAVVVVAVAATAAAAAAAAVAAAAIGAVSVLLVSGPDSFSARRLRVYSMAFCMRENMSPPPFSSSSSGSGFIAAHSLQAEYISSTAIEGKYTFVIDRQGQTRRGEMRVPAVQASWLYICLKRGRDTHTQTHTEFKRVHEREREFKRERDAHRQTDIPALQSSGTKSASWGALLSSSSASS